MGQLKLKVLIEAIDRLTGPVRRMARGLRIELPNAARIGTAALRGLTGVAVKAGAALGAIRVGSQFEQYQAVLETIEGSAEQAQRSMKWVTDFARTTPYEVAQVMEAYVALRAYGIDPTDGSLRTLGDTASAMNKPLMAAIEMLADAQTGEFERLKEFGVRGSAAGNQVRLTYQKAGREVAVTSSKAASDIRKNLLGVFDSRFSGAMARQAGTMKGLWSNLMDMATGFQRDIAAAGLFDFVKAELTSFLALVNAASADGRMAVWAKQISAGLVELLKALKELVVGVDWIGLIRATIDVANGFVDFMNAIGGFRGLVDGVVAGAIGWLTTALMGLGVTIAGIAGVAAAPVAAVIAALGLLAVAGWFVYRNWSSIWAALKAGWNGFVDFLGGVWKRIQSAFAEGVRMVWNILPAWFRTVLIGGAFVIRTVANIAGGGSDRSSPRPRPPGGGGRAASGQVAVDVQVSDDRVRTTTRSSNPQAVPVTTTQRRGAF